MIILNPGFETAAKKTMELENLDVRYVIMSQDPKEGSHRLDWDTISRNDLLKGLIDALISPVAKSTKTKTITSTAEAETLEFTGNTVGEVTEAVNKEFNKRQWTDGLPIVPPTEDRIQWMLKGTDLSPIMR